MTRIFHMKPFSDESHWLDPLPGDISIYDFGNGTQTVFVEVNGLDDPFQHIKSHASFMPDNARIVLRGTDVEYLKQNGNIILHEAISK